MKRPILLVLLLATPGLSQTPRDKELLTLAQRYSDPATGPGDLTTIAARFRREKPPHPARALKKVLSAPATPSMRARQAQLVVAGAVGDGWLDLEPHLRSPLAADLVAAMFAETTWPEVSLQRAVRRWRDSEPTAPDHEPMTAGFVGHPNLAARALPDFAKELGDEASRAAAARIVSAVLELEPGLSIGEVSAAWEKRRAVWEDLARTDWPASEPEAPAVPARIESAPPVLFRGENMYLRAGAAVMYRPADDLDDRPHEVLIRFRAVKEGFRLGYGTDGGFWTLTFARGRLTYPLADRTERWLECDTREWHTLRFEVTPDHPADGRFQRRRAIRIYLDDKPFEEVANTMNGVLQEAFADADDTGGEVLVRWVTIRER